MKIPQDRAFNNTIKAISSLAKEYGSLADIELIKVIESKRLSVLVVNKGDAAKVVGKEGGIVKLLSKKLGKLVKILEISHSERNMIESLLRPANVLGVNILYTPNKEQYKVRVPLKDKALLQLTPSDFETITKSLVGKAMQLHFE